MQNEIETAKLESTAQVHIRELGGRRSWRVSVHPVLRNVGLTGVTSLITSIAAMTVISLVGRDFGPALLGEYLLVRRIASWLQAVVVLPSGVALPRYVAANLDEPNATRQTYFLVAMVTGCGLALLLTAVFLLWEGPTSRLILGNAELAPLILPLGLLLVGLGAHCAVFGYYQGTLSMGRACALQLFNLAIFPVLAVVLLSRKHSIPLIIETTGLLIIACAFLFSIPILYQVPLAVVARRALKSVSELFSFGISRTWGDFGLQALLSLPAVIAAHSLPMQSVSFLLLGGSFLALVAAATLPIGIILLSQVTRSLAQRRMAQLRMQVAHFVDALIESSFFIALQMVVFAGPIVVIWVGPSFISAIPVVKILILAVPFYFVYGGLRSVVDAAALKAHNTRNILISLAVFVVVVLVFELEISPEHLLEALALSVVIAMGVLAGLTLRTVTHLFELRVHWNRLLPGIAVAAVLGGCSFVLSRFLNFQPNLFILALYETLALGLYLGALWLLGSPWLRFLLKTMFVGQAFIPEPLE